jgi:hypothetical protein
VLLQDIPAHKACQGLQKKKYSPYYESILSEVLSPLIYYLIGRHFLYYLYLH